MLESLKPTMLNSPVAIRVATFFVFLLLTYLQGRFGEASRYWFYLGKTIAGVGMIWVMRPFVKEMRWKWSWEAVVVGVAVCALWVGLDNFYPHLGQSGTAWNPLREFGSDSTLAALFIAVRILGSTFIVPPLEEVFYRSFVYRFIIRQDFETVPQGTFNWTSFLITSAIFGLAHHQWLAGILCGFAYQGLVCRKKRLGDAMTAHAITNFLLGVWILWKGDWKFW